MALLSVALTEARALLNDPAGTLWTDAFLLPFAQKAHREMQIKIACNGLPVLKKKTAVIDVLAGATDLGVDQPADLIEPIAMSERATGTTDLFVPMIERDRKPDEIVGSTLRYWWWEEETIRFLGATTTRDIQLYYLKGLTVPAAGGASIGLLLGETYIGPRTAALAGASIGNNTVLDTWTPDADARIEDIVKYNVQGQQNLPVRRRAYRPRRRVY